jgi:hypothetical protein
MRFEDAPAMGDDSANLPAIALPLAADFLAREGDARPDVSKIRVEIDLSADKLRAKIGRAQRGTQAHESTLPVIKN